MPVTEVELDARPLGAFAPIVGQAKIDELASAAEKMRGILAGAVVWNVNSTAGGGGVAEMLRAILPYTRGLGIDSRWLVIAGDPDFFRITKRLHHALHGSEGDGSRLDAAARALFRATSRENADDLRALVRSGDVVILHDPQTAALVGPLTEMGARVVWRSHIGTEQRNRETESGWAFLRPHVERAQALVFTRRQYVPEWAADSRVAIIPPSIDPFSPKNRDMDAALARDILACAGILADGRDLPQPPVYLRHDGSSARLEHCADVVCLGPAPDVDQPAVVQVSRWDPLKDPVGVMRGFVEFIHLDPASKAFLMLAGPSVKSIEDDPEQPATMDEVIAEWRELPHALRTRIRLVNLPMADLEENAAMVNALQRHAAVVVQKSLREGFGLTVTEAMWKARPVIASAVGGIQDQIEDGRSGILLQDPSDPKEFAAALHRVLSSPQDAAALGQAARQTVIENYLAVRHLLDYEKLLTRLLADEPAVTSL
jgi:trehalose synthase